MESNLMFASTYKTTGAGETAQLLRANTALTDKTRIWFPKYML